MGLLQSLKRWFNQSDAYDQLTTLNRSSLILGRKRVDAIAKPMYNQFNEADEPSEPSESLPDVELDRETSQAALDKREAAIEHERRRRESRH
jgi:hypothetical protein